MNMISGAFHSDACVKGIFNKKQVKDALKLISKAITKEIIELQKWEASRLSILIGLIE